MKPDRLFKAVNRIIVPVIILCLGHSVFAQSVPTTQVLTVTVKEGRAKGDWILNWAFLTIVYKDGRGPGHLWVNAVYVIENGKIESSRTFYNEADVLRQLHYTIDPSEEIIN